MRYRLGSLGWMLAMGLAGGAVAAHGQTETELTRIAAQSPREAVKTFSSGAGFRVELLAAEPLVADPVVLKYDAEGRAFVCEMADYPYTDPRFDLPWKDQPSPPGGRVRVLYDDDGDGRFDRSRIFVDGISWPTGIAFWKGGLFVAATPDLWYFKDADGDGRADIRRKVFTGFRKYNVQAVMNNLQWGLDGWIYGAGGSNGGTIRNAAHPDRSAVRLGRSDFRFHPETLDFEVIPGGARFGNAFDDWGERFITNIRNPLRHAVLPRAVLAGNRYLPVSSALHDAAPAGDALRVFRTSPAEPWRVINARRLERAGSPRTPRSERAATGYVTSACGVTIYRGSRYPPEFYGDAFIAEVAGNLIMRYRLSPKGVTFSADHWLSRDGREFLASSDNWFRPVNFVNAPDGTLHLVDMYRQTIEHPWSIPDDLKSKLDLRRGSHRGRIYRLVPPGYRSDSRRSLRPRLAHAGIPELVRRLDHPDGWWRDTAFRLIYERNDRAAASHLRALMESVRTPRTKLLALWSLEHLDALEPRDLEAARRSDEPRLRRQVVRLAGRHVPSAVGANAAKRREADCAEAPVRDARPVGPSRWEDFIVAGIGDRDMRVRFESAIQLARVARPDVVDRLAAAARRDGADPWCCVAIATAGIEREEKLIEALMAAIDRAPNRVLPVIERLAEMIARRGEKGAVDRAVSIVSNRDGDSRPSRGSLSHWWRIASFLRAGRAADRRTERWYERLIRAARRIALGDDQIPISLRSDAVRFLAHWPEEQKTKDVLVACLDRGRPYAVQRAAIEGLRGVPEEIARRLAAWTPALQRVAVAVLLRSEQGTRALLRCIERHELPRTFIALNQRSQLLNSPDPAVRDLAERLLGEAPSADRADVVRRFEPALELRGVSRRGREIYRRECAACHRLGSDGKQVGPDLDGVAHRAPKDLLLQILDPDREVAPEFQRYAVVTTDGRVRSGIIREETPSSITLVEAEGNRTVLLRADVEVLRAESRSLMPVGFEEKMTLQEMADLLALLRGEAGR